jgi:hypothetical protein
MVIHEGLDLDPDPTKKVRIRPDRIRNTCSHRKKCSLVLSPL